MIISFHMNEGSYQLLWWCDMYEAWPTNKITWLLQQYFPSSRVFLQKFCHVVNMIVNRQPTWFGARVFFEVRKSVNSFLIAHFKKC